MFVDASVIIAIIGGESDQTSLAERLARTSTIKVSAIVLYEATTGLARKRSCSIEQAEKLVDMFLAETAAEIIAIDATTGREAVSAFRRYGKGRHKAALNMGDCFAYACARQHGLPLLYKGNDFPQTDITAA